MPSNVLAQKIENKTMFHCFDSYFEDYPFLTMIEDNDLFLLLDESTNGSDTFIAMSSSKEEIEKALHEFLKKEDYSTNIKYLDKNIDMEYIENMYNYINDYDSIEFNDLDKVLKEISEVTKKLNEKMANFYSFYLQDIHIEYRNRKRTSEKKIKIFEYFLNFKVQKMESIYSVSDKLETIKNELKKDSEILLYIDTYIYECFTEQFLGDNNDDEYIEDPEMILVKKFEN